MRQLSLIPRTLILLIALVFSACQSKVVGTQSASSLLYDQGFPEFSKFDIESEEKVFHLDDIAKAFVTSTIEPMDNKMDQMEALVKAIFNRSELNLLYQGSANTGASETFHNRAANCLSMSIMTYALAKEAGFEADFQEIMIPEYWTMRAGFSLLNGHINIKIWAPKQPHVFELNRRSYSVDFDPQPSRREFPKKVVSKRIVLSMFYNNKGADAFLRREYARAYAYFRESLLLTPSFQSAWINLGILYKVNAYLPQAESAYQQALAIDSTSLTALENLAYLYQFTERKEQAEIMLRKVEVQRNSNPYYHVNLAEQEMERKHWDQALTHFRRALALDRGKHEIYFGLARAYFEIGELQQSERYLKLAKNKAYSKRDVARYQTKLNFLGSL